LGTIAQEKLDCIKAWKRHNSIQVAWCCHHEVLIDLLTEPFMSRINYISSDKPSHEQATRFRSFRPVRIGPAKLIKASNAYAKARNAYIKASNAYAKARNAYSIKTTVKFLNKDWPDNTWSNGRVQGT